jgi:hypothetical protein
MTKSVLIVGLLAFLALHQDFWLWREARPLFLGTLPAGLTYHAVYTLVASVVVWVVARAAGIQDAGDEGR